MGASVNHPQPLLIREGSRASQTQVCLAAGTYAVSKRSKLGFSARIESSIWVRFEFVFKMPCLFSITYWLRSYHFLFSRTSVCPSAGTIVLFLAVRSLSTTMCPQNDHHCRLSYIPKFVKRKMQVIRAAEDSAG